MIFVQQKAEYKVLSTPRLSFRDYDIVVYFSGEAGVPILTNDILVHDITPARTPVVAEQRIGGRGSCGYSALRLYVQV